MRSKLWRKGSDVVRGFWSVIRQQDQWTQVLVVGRDLGSQVSKDNELKGKELVTEQCP